MPRNLLLVALFRRNFRNILIYLIDDLQFLVGLEGYSLILIMYIH